MPIAVIPHDTTFTSTNDMVVAVDGSPNSLSALEWSLGFARPGTTIRVIWVWDATPLAVGADEFFFPDASATAETRFHHLIDEVVENPPGNDVTIERSFIHGRPRTAIAEAAAAADMLVLGARGHGAVGSALLGSVSTWLLHHVEIPVVVVPHPPDDTDAADEAEPADD
jgi:nucleotide-binding universal stress UspA family protein